MLHNDVMSNLCRSRVDPKQPRGARAQGRHHRRGIKLSGDNLPCVWQTISASILSFSIVTFCLLILPLLRLPRTRASPLVAVV